MMKFLGGVVVGVFFGAMAVEVLARTRPGLFAKLEQSARDTADRLGDYVGRGSAADREQGYPHESTGGF